MQFGMRTWFEAIEVNFWRKRFSDSTQDWEEEEKRGEKPEEHWTHPRVEVRVRGKRREKSLIWGKEEWI